MMGSTHAAIAAAAVAGLQAAGALPISGADVGIAALAAVLPDVDTPYSYVGRRLSVVATPLFLSCGHRGAVHSLAVGGLVLASLAFIPVIPTHLLIAAAIGWASHLLADLVSGGAAIAWPFVPHRVGRAWIQTGGIGDWLLGGAALLALGKLAASSGLLATLLPGHF